MQSESSSGKVRPLVGHTVGRRDESQMATADVSSQGITLLLVSVAILVHAIVVADGRYGMMFYGWFAIQIALMLTGAWYFRQLVIRMGANLIVSPLLVVAGQAAPIWELGSRHFMGAGQPFEIVTMTAIRNLVLGLAVVSVWPNQQRLAVALSLFLAMFGVTASHDISTQWLAGQFAIGAVCWLIVSHWENVQLRLKGREKVQWPRWALLAPVFLILVIGISSAGLDRRVTTALRGFLPSSGGTGDSDPYARDGVGNGEMLVAGTERIQSFAPIEDAPFMQDDQPSLYDLFDDTYEEEVKISKTDRAIALPPELASRAQEHLHHRTEKANREFSVLRQPKDPTKSHHGSDIHSNALFYVAGRVPLHLRLQVYDLFDGQLWYPEQKPNWQRPFEVANSGGKPWLQIADRGEIHEFLGPAETHALKIVRMDTNVIPAPLFLHGVHIDLVDRSDMFQHGPDGLVALDRDTLPTLVPIHIASRPIDWDVLRTESANTFPTQGKNDALRNIPDSLNSTELRQLANEWSDGSQRGWQQIRAITDRLRSEYALDPAWRPTQEAGAVAEFLFDSKRGPDYQFATAAALLLRSLGYATRVVSGFYADPQRYDVASRHTPVLEGDVHFWTEVRVSAGGWIPVEASPGYELLGPPPGLLQRAWNACVSVIEFCGRNALACTITLFVTAILWWYRRSIEDQANTLQCLFWIWWKPELAISSTIRLLRQRAKLAKRSPDLWVTHHQWLSTLLTNCDDSDLSRMLYQLRQKIDIAAYAPHQLGSSESELCLAVIRRCRLGWFNSLHSESKPANRPGKNETQVVQTELLEK